MKLKRCFAILTVCSGLFWAVSPAGIAVAQERTAEGFRRYEGKYIELLTDLPDRADVNAELEQLPKAFDAAMPLWCEYFGVKLSEVEDWQAQACIMLEKERFRGAGLIPAGVPEFPYGFQYYDQLFVSEQPSAYYRRHLLIHEGTHWFMSRHFGANAPPWIMEGMAEWFGTHRWNSETQQLELSVVPADKTLVPYWGRVRKIREQLEAGTAPSLEDIMQYDNTAHRSVDAYAWSWAAVVFMVNHPDTKEAFREVLQQPMRPDMTQTRWLFAKLKARWPSIREQWNAFTSDLDYGWSPQGGMLTISNKPTKLAGSSTPITIHSDRSWQASSVYATAGSKIRIRATGSYEVAQLPKPWVCFADGVTLEYYRGQPLGRLMLAISTPRNKPSATQQITILPLATEAVVEMPQTGELHFRVNEASRERSDNQGELTVQIELLEK